MAPSRATAASKAAIFSAVSGAAGGERGMRRLQRAEQVDQGAEAALGGVVVALLGDAAEDGVALPGAEPAVGGDARRGSGPGRRPALPAARGVAPRVPCPGSAPITARSRAVTAVRCGAASATMAGTVAPAGGGHAVRQVRQGGDAGEAGGAHRLGGTVPLVRRTACKAVRGGAGQQGAGRAGSRLDRLPARQLRQAMGIVAERGEARHQHLAGRLRGARGGRAEARRAGLAAADGEADRGILALRHALEAVHPQDQRHRRWDRPPPARCRGEARAAMADPSARPRRSRWPAGAGEGPGCDARACGRCLDGRQEVTPATPPASS